jgi:hypothetical protein
LLEARKDYNQADPRPVFAERKKEAQRERDYAGYKLAYCVRRFMEEYEKDIESTPVDLRCLVRAVRTALDASDKGASFQEMLNNTTGQIWVDFNRIGPTDQSSSCPLSQMHFKDALPYWNDVPAGMRC